MPNSTEVTSYCILGFGPEHSVVVPTYLILFYILPSAAYSIMSFGLNYLIRRTKRFFKIWIFWNQNFRNSFLRTKQAQTGQILMDKFYLDVVRYGFSDAVLFLVLWFPYNMMSMVAHMINEHRSRGLNSLYRNPKSLNPKKTEHKSSNLKFVLGQLDATNRVLRLESLCISLFLHLATKLLHSIPKFSATPAQQFWVSYWFIKIPNFSIF